MLYPPTPHIPSQSHRFLHLLENENRLLRIYTQNIDGLEERAGVSPKKIVYAHGSPEVFRCLTCGTKIDSCSGDNGDSNNVEQDRVRKDVMKGLVPRCKRRRKIRAKKSKEEETNNGNIRKRRKIVTSESTSSYLPRPQRHSGKICSDTNADNDNDNIDNLCNGTLKPGITFFGETLNSTVSRTFEGDRKKADAVIVIGTSLSVAPVSKMLEILPRSIPRILINRTLVAPAHTSANRNERILSTTLKEKDVEDEDEDFRNGYIFDVCLLGFCDSVTGLLAKVMKDVEQGNQNEGKYANGSGGDNCRKMDPSLQIALKEGSVLTDESRDVAGAQKRTLLFPGAIVKDKSIEISNQSIEYAEVAHCDGCQNIIQGTIMKCVNCFDFDLCKECYHPIAIKRHYGGTHTFVEERL